MLRKLMILAVSPFVIVAGIFYGIYSVFVRPKEQDTRSKKQCKAMGWSCMYCQKILDTPGYQCEQCRVDALEPPRIRLQDLPKQESDLEFVNRQLEGVIMFTEPPLDAERPEDVLMQEESDQAKFGLSDDDWFSESVEAFNPLISDERQGLAYEQELDRKLDEFAASDTGADIQEIADLDSN